jgi:hypothetical protein
MKSDPVTFPEKTTVYVPLGVPPCFSNLAPVWLVGGSVLFFSTVTPVGPVASTTLTPSGHDATTR